MNIRRATYLQYLTLRGSTVPKVYKQIIREDELGVSANHTERALQSLLEHCRAHVPHYARIMREVDADYQRDPVSYLQAMPVLDKHTLRSQFEALKSDDLDERQWRVTSSGGSTGQPVRVIYDKDYDVISTAVSHLFSRWAGREIGESLIYLWGSDRDVFRGSVGWKAKVFNRWLNVRLLNAFRMSPESMRDFIAILNAQRPKLIISYAQAMYELAAFAEKNGIAVEPQRSILTSAGTLYPFMRETIERVFQCKVFNRYGTREVSAIASQCSEHRGLHVSPWTQYVEIVDDAGRPLPPGEEGRILVTSLANYAMPLIRYDIGDRGVLAAESVCACGRRGQILQTVSGRSSDNFRTADGKVVPGEYFIHLIGVVLNTQSIERFQVIQHAYDRISVKVVPAENGTPVDANAIAEKIKVVMGQSCAVVVQFVEDIPPSPSGKYLYTVSEVPV